MSLQPQETQRRITASVLCDILAQIAAALAGNDSFSAPGTTILTEDKGDIDTEINQKLGSLGLAVTVMFSGVSDAKANLAGPVFGSGKYIVEVAENALTNRSAGGATALEVAEQAARILHQFSLSSNRALLVESIQPYPNAPAPANVCYHVTLKTTQVSINRKVES